MLAHGAKYQSERVSQTLPYLSVISYVCNFAPFLIIFDKTYRAAKISNFFYFLKFQKNFFTLFSDMPTTSLQLLHPDISSHVGAYKEHTTRFSIPSHIHYTSVPRLDQELRHFLEIAYSRICRYFLSLTTSMLFLPSPSFNGNCYKIGTLHAREVCLGSLELS